MEQEECLLSDQVGIDGHTTAATLSADGQLRWGDRRLDMEKHVLGFSVEGLKVKIRAVVEAGGGFCCCSGKPTLIRKTFVLELLSDDSLRIWTQKLQDYLDSLGRPKRLFIFVNPYGGKKSALNIFQNDVKPLLDDANVEYTVQETKYQLHAKEVVQSLDLAEYDGIICVSGDGILVEVLNGLLIRKDWDEAIRIPLGAVPAGTGNGMAKSLLDSNGEPCAASNATLFIIRGHKRSLDIATMSQRGTRFFSLLMLAWGLVADIDIESEKYRWMGSARLDFYGLQRIFGLRRYHGSITFVPAPGYEFYGEPLDLHEKIMIDGESEIKSEAGLVRDPEYGYRGPTLDVKSLDWRKIDGPFVSIWLHNVPWGGEDTIAAPDAKFSDGCLDLIMIKDCPKLGLLKLMGELNNGGHVKSPYVSYLKVKAFILQPGSRTDDPNKGGIIDVDGEVLARGKGVYKCEEKTLMSYDKLVIKVDRAEVCFNSNCKGTSEKWRRGWRRRTGEYAHLCDRCASAYEDGKFCETFHMSASGWRCCESCRKQIHCGCIVSFHMFVLLDAGGIECLTCAKKSFILTPNPAWPPPLPFLPSQPERMKDLSLKSWNTIAGSGPVPWHQAPSLFNSSGTHANVQLRMPFEVDVMGGFDKYGLCERVSVASPDIKQERSYERLANGKLRLGPSETLQNGTMGLNVKEQHCPFRSDFKHIFPRNDSSSNLNLGIASASKNEIDDAPVSAILSQPRSVSNPVGKRVCSQSVMDSSGEFQICNGKSRVDGRSRNQLLPRYRPQITDEELQQISGDSKSVITPLFEKMLSASDAGRIGRLVLPKKCAEAYFPPINHPEGLPLKVQDIKAKEWVFQFRFWPNNNSRMYVLEGITPCIQSMQLQAGDIVTFSRLEPEGKLIMGGRKASAVPPLEQGEVTAIGNEASSPGDGIAMNKSMGVISANGHVKERILEDKPAIHVKRKNSNLSAKTKRLRIENDHILELKLTYKEAQGLMRAPAKIVPSSFVVDGCEFEEFEEAGPVIGRPTIFGMDHSGEKIQCVQCEDCLKWRKVPADALVSSKWTCPDNVWDCHGSRCASPEELTNEQLKHMLTATNKVESSGRDADLVALEGLDTLANLAIGGEGDGLLASSENKTKHPRHKPGCSCIVCLQPPSGKGTKHPQSCDCVVCTSLKRRFRTMMERRERKQFEKDTESPPSSSQNLQGQQSLEKEQDVDACPGSSAGISSLNQDELTNSAYLEEPSVIKLSTSPLKGRIDLNIQPEREEDFSPSSDCGAVKCIIPGSTDRFFRQQKPLDRGDLLVKQMQQDGVGCGNTNRSG